MSSQITIDVEVFGKNAHIWDDRFDSVIEFEPGEPWGPGSDNEDWTQSEDQSYRCVLKDQSDIPVLLATLRLGEFVELLIEPNTDANVELTVQGELVHAFVVKTTADWQKLGFETR